MEKELSKYSFMDFLKDKSGYFTNKSGPITHATGIATMVIIGGYIYHIEYKEYSFVYYIIFITLIITVMYLSRKKKVLNK